MVSLTEFRKVADDYNGMKREVRSFPLAPHIRPSRRDIVPDRKELDALRSSLFIDMKEAIRLMKEKIEINTALESLRFLHGYFDLRAICSLCGKEFSEQRNAYENIDFKKLVCSACRSRKKNSAQAKIIEKGTNFVPRFDDKGHLIEVTFDHGKKTYVIRGDTDDEDRPLVFEEG